MLSPTWNTIRFGHHGSAEYGNKVPVRTNIVENNHTPINGNMSGLTWLTT